MGAQGHNIITEYWAKPIPDRQFDWIATLGSKGEDSPKGYGSTELKAIEDLLFELEARGE